MEPGELLQLDDVTVGTKLQVNDATDNWYDALVKKVDVERGAQVSWNGRGPPRGGRGPARGGSSIVTFAQTLLERASPRAPFVTRHPSRAGSTASAPG